MHTCTCTKIRGKPFVLALEIYNNTCTCTCTYNQMYVRWAYSSEILASYDPCSTDLLQLRKTSYDPYSADLLQLRKRRVCTYSSDHTLDDFLSLAIAPTTVSMAWVISTLRSLLKRNSPTPVELRLLLMRHMTWVRSVCECGWWNLHWNIIIANGIILYMYPSTCTRCIIV